MLRQFLAQLRLRFLDKLLLGRPIGPQRRARLKRPASRNEEARGRGPGQVPGGGCQRHARGYGRHARRGDHGGGVTRDAHPLRPYVEGCRELDLRLLVADQVDEQSHEDLAVVLVVYVFAS